MLRSYHAARTLGSAVALRQHAAEVALVRPSNELAGSFPLNRHMSSITGRVVGRNWAMDRMEAR
jgi:hypothetical protein